MSLLYRDFSLKNTPHYYRKKKIFNLREYEKVIAL